MLVVVQVRFVVVLRRRLLTESFLFKVQRARRVLAHRTSRRLDRVSVRTNLQTNVVILTLYRVDCRLGKRALYLPLVRRTLIRAVQIAAVQRVLVNP